jgi:hypothetical protein
MHSEPGLPLPGLKQNRMQQFLVGAGSIISRRGAKNCRGGLLSLTLHGKQVSMN